MMNWTDRHCRYLHRLLSRKALLYTEMVSAAALVKGRALHLLDHSPREHPIALQLGGADPRELAQAARLGAQAGYDEINLNLGCPSDRVQSGAFGAVLMKHPRRAAACVRAMAQAVAVPISVKCRIAVDTQNPEVVLPAFLRQVQEAGARKVCIHARKAWLQGLSPEQNRRIPPLNHDLVVRMKTLHPDLPIVINGGIVSLAQAQAFLQAGLDGVMVGRAAYHRPADTLGAVDRQFFGQGRGLDAVAVVRAMLPYIEAHLSGGGALHHITRHMLGLFANRPGARLWRRTLAEAQGAGGDPLAQVERALQRVLAAHSAAQEAAGQGQR